MLGSETEESYRGKCGTEEEKRIRRQGHGQQQWQVRGLGGMRAPAGWDDCPHDSIPYHPKAFVPLYAG